MSVKGFSIALMALVQGMSFAHASEPVGVSLQATRVVIENGANEAHLGVTNSLRSPILVHSSFETISGEKSNAFMAIPPLFKLDENRTSRLRIVKTAELPQDKESVFYINVVSIPSSKNTGGSQLNIGLGQRIKVFYRPKNVEGNCQYAAQHLDWSYSKGVLRVNNPTQLSVSMIDFELQGERTKTTMLLPGQQAQWPMKMQKTERISFRYIDEYGGVRTQEVHLNN